MVDKKNLNRIKGILSAKHGAEIPRFQTPAGPLRLSDEESKDIKFRKTNWHSSIYSSDGFNWFLDEELTIPYRGSLEEYEDAELQEPSKVKPPLAIPGSNPSEGNPDAAVDAAAISNQQLAIATHQKATNAEAEQIVTKNTLQKVDPPVSTPTKVVVQDPNGSQPKGIQPKSAGMNFEDTPLAKSQKLGQIRQVAADSITAVGNVFAAKQAVTDSDTTKTADAVYNGAVDAISNFGPWGKAIGGAMKVAGAAGNIIQELGGGTDQQTTTDKWMDSAFFSWNIGMLNGFAGKNSDSFGVDQDTLAQVGSSYGGTASDIQDAAAKADKKYGLFSSKDRKKTNAAIAKAKGKQNLMGDIADLSSDQRLAVQSMGEQAGIAYSLLTDGGYNQKYTYAAKHGGMLEWNPVETLEWEPKVILNWKLPEFKEGGNINIVEELEWIPEFKSGGKTEDSDIPEIEETTQKNVIPEGALHKNKHHMEHAEGLTKKGIPVIDDDGEQQAEIEHSEIIFTLEVTKKLEEYYKIFYSDNSTNKEKEQAAIDVGKLLVFQILENTEDRTGLIESCKKGGALTFKKTTNDLIDEVLEWTPTIVIVEETEIIEKSKKASEKKLDKDIIKEEIKEAIIELLTK